MAAPHASGMALVVLQTHPYLKQASMEAIFKLVARGLPLPASDALVAYLGGGYYPTTWGGGDDGPGFLQANTVLRKANLKKNN